jgi:DNA-binding CsgD family transcriptional regulator
VRYAIGAGKEPETFLIPNVLIETTALLVQNDEHALAEAIISRFESLIADRTNPVISASTTAARAVLIDNPSNYSPALEPLREMKSWTHALLQEQAGACFARHSRVDEAKRFFEGALETFEALDAQRLVARSKKAMRSFGIKRGVRGKRRRPKIGWEALTDAEQRVVSLAASGLTNPQIAEKLYLSRYTVQTHLKNIFAKLDISSRMELAALASRYSSKEPMQVGSD